MFKTPFDIRFIWGCTFLFLAAVALAAALQQMWLLLLPALPLAALLLLQKPVLLHYILVGSIPWSVEYNFSGSLGTDLPDEPLMLLAAFTAIVLLLHKPRYSFKTGLQHGLVLLLAVQFIWMLFTVVTSTHPLISVKFMLAKGWYLLAFVALPLLVLRDKKAWKNTALLLTFSMLVVTSVGLVRHGLDGFTFASINNSLLPFFRNHVNYSALLVCMVPLLVAFIYNSKKRAKALLIFLLLLTLAALYFSYARGAWLALLVGAGAYVLLRKKWLLHTYVLAMLVAIAAVFWLKHNNRYLAYAHDFNTTVFHTNFKQHLVATYKLKDVSTAERFYRWVAGVRMGNERWQTGFGPNTFYHNYRPYTITAFKTWVSNNPEKSTVHNYFLLTLVEQGIVGFLLLLLLLGYAFYTAQQVYLKSGDVFWKWGAACVAVILAMICTVNFLSDLIETDKVGSLFYWCLSFLIVAQRQIAKQQKENKTF